MADNTALAAKRRNIFAVITEQPAPKAIRFRYECEGRSAGSIPGIKSTQENKTFPTIKVTGYKGSAVVVVSCVTRDQPYRPHPHNIVGKGSKKGVCTIEFEPETMTVHFNNLGIQCVKKNDIDSSLRVREEIRVDPFQTGFGHRKKLTSIDLNSVRLCFQVFLENEKDGRYTVPLLPIVSQPIFDKKSMTDLVICKLSHCAGHVGGGQEHIMLVEKVVKEDISIRFFEEHNGVTVWEGMADFPLTNVHKQVAISYKTPKYKTLDIDRPVQVFVQLKRPSDGCTSEPLPFTFYPMDSDPVLKRKRPNNEQNVQIIKQLVESVAAFSEEPNIPTIPDTVPDVPHHRKYKNNQEMKEKPKAPVTKFPGQQPYTNPPMAPDVVASIYNATQQGVDLNTMLNQQLVNTPLIQPHHNQQQSYSPPISGLTYQQQQELHMHLQHFYTVNAAKERISFEAAQRLPGPEHHDLITPNFQPPAQDYVPATVHPIDQQESWYNSPEAQNNFDAADQGRHDKTHDGEPPQKDIAAADQQGQWIDRTEEALNLPQVMNNFDATPTGQEDGDQNDLKAFDVANTNNLSSLMDMVDSHQLFLMQMNSSELASLAMPLIEGHQDQDDTLKDEPSQSKMDEELDDMTDSFNRLSAHTMDELNNLNNIYN